MIIMISYDLNNHERPNAYTDISDMIKRNAKDWYKPLKSQWFVETTDSINIWNDRMIKICDKDDGWFIIQIKQPYTGWLSKKFWDWLRERI